MNSKTKDNTLVIAFIILASLLAASFVMLFLLNAKATKTEEPTDDAAVPTISQEDEKPKNTTPIYPTVA